MISQRNILSRKNILEIFIRNGAGEGFMGPYEGGIAGKIPNVSR
jgi:hypothetical protein